ncbi:MAG: sensor histidine kinase [Lysobacteraceae bacterium]|jgi:signal transduction histidine kinase|nr:histidine kinase [Xanthomonadaceae bacterium]MCZ8319366.1 histidine kinase [Silanimonas sp.]
MANSIGANPRVPMPVAPLLPAWRRMACDAARWWTVWMLPVSLFLPLRLMVDSMSLRPVGVVCLLLDALLESLLWLAATPVLLAMQRRHPLQWRPSLRIAAAHATAAVCVAAANSVGHLLGGLWLHRTLQPGLDLPPWPDMLLLEALYRGPINLILYGAAAAAIAAWQAHVREHARERSLTQARLDALASQIEPHMLFNTLNAISEIVYRDAEGADRALCRLGDLLRTLMARRSAVHPLGEERRLVDQYLSVHEVLLGERLRVSIDIPRALDDVPVPSLLLQPLVENAFRHARPPPDGPLEVWIGAHADGDHLVVSVRNNGIAPDAGTGGFGLGLRNTRERLGALYRDDAQVHCDFGTAGAGFVSVRLPMAAAP